MDNILHYEKLKEYIAKKLPKEYYTDTLIEDRVIPMSADVRLYNFSPYRNGGEILPIYYRYYDKDAPTDDKSLWMEPYYNMPRGFKFFPTYILAMKKYEEMNLLPCLLVYLYLRQLLGSKYVTIKLDRINARHVLNQSRDELVKNEYGAISGYCNRLFADVDIPKEEYEKYESSDELYAEIIVQHVKNTINSYRIVRWCYSDDDYKRAYSCIKNVK